MRSAPITYLFGNCEVRVATRELLVDGQLKAAQPKVFDLLTFLLQERSRAVSKEELIDQVWQGADLTESVLARTVMLVRRLIGDTSEQPSWIQNLYGFGYRFIGSVAEHAQSPGTVHSTPVVEQGSGRFYRIGLFPVLNQTGDVSLAWTQVGVMALVGHALERDRRLVPTAIGSDFLQQLPPGTTMEAAARQACEFFGLDRAVHAVLRSQADTRWMDYRVYGDHEAGGIGSLRDNDPVVMAERLASAIAAHVLNGAHLSGAMPSRDAFVNQVFARAMECASTEDWKTASGLLAAARALEPENLKIELESVRCQVLLNDATALASAESLHDRALLADEPRLLGGCHDLIAQALTLSGDLAAGARAAEHRQRALDLADDSGPVDWALSIRINVGSVHLENGKLGPARSHLERALSDARSSSNLNGVARCQQNLAIADRNQGNLLQAKQRLEESLQIWHRVPRRPARGQALMELAQANLHLGLFDEASKQCDDSLACFDLKQLGPQDAATVAGLCLLYLHLGRLDSVDRLAAQLIEAFGRESPKPAPLQVALACTAIGSGKCSTARKHLLSAIQHPGSRPGLDVRLSCLHAWLHMELANGDEQQLEACRLAFEGMTMAAEWPEWNAGVRYVQAAQLHLHQERAKALNALMSMAVDLPLSMSGQMARLDAAWLLLEQGDLVTANTMMGGAPTWRDAHPAGLALKARVHASQGRYDEAWKLQKLALARHRLVSHPIQEELATVYERLLTSKKSEPTAAIPALPRLLCATTVSRQRELKYA